MQGKGWCSSTFWA